MTKQLDVITFEKEETQRTGAYFTVWIEVHSHIIFS